MPRPDAILAGLRHIANDAIVVAVVWHVLTLAAVVALVSGRRPPKRWAGVLASAPILSASVTAFIYGNPFNGTLLGLLAATLIATAARLGTAPAPPASMLEKLLGTAMIVFAWTYPHFLDAMPATTYLYAAPMGIIPCPTLALVTGFALVLGGLGSRSWSVILASGGLFYGLFGVVRLGVTLDLPLIAGASALLLLAIRAVR